MANIIVCGAIANRFQKSGEVWHRLQWVIGLRRLGCTVRFVEQISRAECVDAAGNPTGFEESANRAFLRDVAAQFGWADSAVLVYERGEAIDGGTYPELLAAAADADLLVNVSGHLTLEDVLRRVRKKVYLDEDPGFTQFWHAAGTAGFRLDGYDHYYTVGENIGSPDCPIPTGGIPWRSTRPFAVLDQWPLAGTPFPDRFTTIGSWRGPYGSIEYGGKTYGLKAHQFRKFLDLPRRAPGTFELALDIHPADAKDRDSLLRKGWNIVDPKIVVPEPQTFRQYIQGSAAEFSTAKGIYVETNSGWFSDRTVRYLASGKPTLVQDTGFGRHIPTGEGLLTFRTLDEAVVGAERILQDYEKHCRAARALAEEYFCSDVVLGRFLEEVGIAP